MMRTFRSPALTTGLALVIAIAAAAIATPLVVRVDPHTQLLRQSLEPPSASALLGRDQLGRDVLSRVLVGSRLSLGLGVTVVSLSLIVGVGVGTLAGWRGNWVDEGLMRGIDILLAFPGLLLAIALAAALGPSARSTVVALCATGWTGYARIVRGEVIAWKRRELVTAAAALGASSWRIVMLHVLPQLLPPLAVQATAGIAGAIVAEASLSFLGLGVPPPAPTWGTMINEARAFLLVAPHLAVAPGLAMTATVLGFTLIGDGLRDLFDVKASEPATGITPPPRRSPETPAASA
jgi:peptide/nickel transport system permease protein